MAPGCDLDRPLQTQGAVLSSRKLALDAGWSWVLIVSVRAAGTLAFILISRLRSAPEAGTFTLALGYLAILTTLFLGIDDILVREVARQPEQTWSILTAYGGLRVGLSGLAWAALVALLRLVPAYSRSDLFIILVIASSILPDTLFALGQAALNAHQDFRTPVVAGMAVTLLKLGGIAYGLWRGLPLESVAWAWPLGSLAAAVGVALVVVVRRPGWVRRPAPWSLALTARFARQIPTFAGASLAAALDGQLDVILLSILAARAVVAEYVAATTILTLTLTISQALRAVIYPRLVRSLADGIAPARRMLVRTLLAMGGLAILLASAIALLASPLVAVIFHGRFVMASGVLRVLIWSAVFFFTNVPLTRFLMAANGQAAILAILLVSLAANLSANLVLIPAYGPLGPAWARLLSSGLFTLLAAVQVYILLRRSAPLSVARGG
jgi:PST family polysaccharide transporter